MRQRTPDFATQMAKTTRDDVRRKRERFDRSAPAAPAAPAAPDGGGSEVAVSWAYGQILATGGSITLSPFVPQFEYRSSPSFPFPAASGTDLTVPHPGLYHANVSVRVSSATAGSVAEGFVGQTGGGQWYSREVTAPVNSVGEARVAIPYLANSDGTAALVVAVDLDVVADVTVDAIVELHWIAPFTAWAIVGGGGEL